MASVYTQLKKGSSGSEVNALQTALSNKGYTLQSTGLYDDATEAAVRKYQQDNNLTVDGIAGDVTLNALYGQSSGSTGGFTPSAQLQQAQQQLQSMQQQKPSAYQSAYTPQLQAQFDAIMNRQAFQYDAATDPAFQQMTDLYTQQGRRAMQETMGQSMAMTGGYGNSYAQGAGQAAYGQYMQNLNALAPEYMNAAYTRWQNEGVDMVDRYNMIAARDESDYGRYTDQLNQYFAELDRAQQNADTLYNREYGAYQDNLNWQQALDEAAFQREQYQGKLNSEAKEYAYQTAMMLLQGGQMPSAELLAAAGISAADAQLLQEMYTPKSSGSGGGGDDKKKWEEAGEKAVELRDTAAIVGGVMNQLASTTATGGATPILTYQEWNAKNPAPNAKSAAGKISESNRDAYEEYVTKQIKQDYKEGKISPLDVLRLTAQYLPSNNK